MKFKLRQDVWYVDPTNKIMRAVIYQIQTTQMISAGKKLVTTIFLFRERVGTNSFNDTRNSVSNPIFASKEACALSWLEAQGISMGNNINFKGLMK